jgi:hypothetical protein
MAGRRNSAAEFEGWSHSPPDPLEKSDEYEVTRTDAGSGSVARALFAIRARLREDAEDRDAEDPTDDEMVVLVPPQHAIETIPAPAPGPSPAKSDIRLLGPKEESGADAFTVYVDELMAAVEIEARTVPPPRSRRETLVMPTRPRQPTLPMIERPLQTPATPQAAIVPPVQRTASMRRQSAPDSVPPAPFRGSGAILLLAFGIGIALAAVMVLVLGAL